MDQPQIVRFATREIRRSRHITVLGRTSSMWTYAQVLRAGGENKLHSHPNMDGFWFVLSGLLRFYTTDDVVVAELGANEGIIVPHGYPYWFESVGDEDVRLIQVESFLTAGDTPKKVMHQGELSPDMYELVEPAS